MDNREIAAVLFNISTLLAEQRGNPYRIRAYRRAARNILRARHSLVERAAAGEPLGIPFLGKRLTAKITQMARDGRCDFYDELCADLPTSEQALLKVPGIGPKLAGRITRDLGTPDAEELVARAANRGLQRVWGIGPKRAAAILAGITTEQPASGPNIVRDGNMIYVQESFWHGEHKKAA
jgi:DNA polymerase/3'-5' exonuclease PolX